MRKMMDAGVWSFRYIQFLEDVKKMKDKESIIIAFGKLQKTKTNKGRCVLFLDSHVEFMREDTFRGCLNNMLTFDHVSPEQKAYWRGFIEGMKGEGEG
ncbi:MAG: hypothetical protein GXP25_06920 [Planctomycetes bacterium]|nr:hypothetical protein [Planctomycetota bacterium]